MNKTETLRAMKALRGNDTIILFHNGNYFEAYEEDARTISKQLNLETIEEDGVLILRIPEDKEQSTTNLLLDAEFAVCVSDMRDSDGNFTANINIIEDE